MPSFYYQTLSLKDKTKEIGTVTVFHDEVTAASLPNQLTRWDNWKTAVAGQCFNNVDKNLTVLQAEELAIDPPGSNYAQRENKLRIVYKSGDPTKNKLYQIEVPSVDLGKVVLLPKSSPTGPDPVAWTAAQGATAETIALIAAFIELASTPDDPNDGKNATGGIAVKIEGVYFVTRKG